LWVETGGILLYVEDFKRGTNTDIGPKDIFEMGYNKACGMFATRIPQEIGPATDG
jgi:hypothetical protein